MYIAHYMYRAPTATPAPPDAPTTIPAAHTIGIDANAKHTAQEAHSKAHNTHSNLQSITHSSMATVYDKKAWSSGARVCGARVVVS